MLELRPHHIFCMFFYMGFGYNKEFVDNMNIIEKRLFMSSNEIIRIIKRCDDICAKCPNKQKGNCNEEEKVIKLDNNMINEFGLEENKEYRFNEIINNIYKKINQGNLLNVCNDCKWFKDGTCSVDKICNQSIKWTSL